ncbi:MAG: HAD family acid phosphatase [Woeseiaceae bacterium]
MFVRLIVVLIFSLGVVACEKSPPPVEWTADKDLGLSWVKHAAEYQALSLQAYHQAERDLPGFLADRRWTALPGQTRAEYLPPAIIFDVDETVVSGVDFQLAVERPVDQTKLNDWNSSHNATAVQGFAAFAAAANAAGVELFFITNRPCEAVDGSDSPCPYKETVVNDIREAGFNVDADHVQLVNEQPGWTKEKLARREALAETHRIIMLFGDDLSDFIPCTRPTPAAPCTNAGTADSRTRKVAQFSGYWGSGWYILPNPMHGSWSSVPRP